MKGQILQTLSVVRGPLNEIILTCRHYGPDPAMHLIPCLTLSMSNPVVVNGTANTPVVKHLFKWFAGSGPMLVSICTVHALNVIKHC